MFSRGVKQTFRVLKIDDSSVSDLKEVASFKMLGTTNQSECCMTRSEDAGRETLGLGNHGMGVGAGIDKSFGSGQTATISRLMLLIGIRAIRSSGKSVLSGGIEEP